MQGKDIHICQASNMDIFNINPEAKYTVIDGE